MLIQRDALLLGMNAPCLFKGIGVSSFYEEVEVVHGRIFVKGEMIKFRIWFFLIQKAEQDGRIRYYYGHFSDQPFDAVCLLRYDFHLIFFAAVKQVGSVVPNKFFCIFGDILRKHTGFF